MVGRVHKLDVSNVRDIPAMLEQWAAWLRDGAEEKPETLLMILVPPDEGVPELCVFGEEHAAVRVGWLPAGDGKPARPHGSGGTGVIHFTCPCCGADFPWEAGLIEADAKRLGAVLGDMEPALARAAMSYLRLFKPLKTALRLSRATKLLQDLAALIAEGTVCRDERTGVRRPAPVSAWVAGIEQMLQQADRLTLPLSAHGYLRQVVFGIADAADAAAEKSREQDLREGRRQAGPSPSKPPGTS
ncbi:hypothetical protein [Rhodanobacter lindaniclasticus]